MTSTNVAQTMQQPKNDVRTPLWRRITAVFTLSSLVVLSGLILAGVITLTVLMLLFLLERAIA